MYTILVVDDERIIREGVRELLMAEDGLELDILTAQGVPEAMEMLERRRVDIVLTDIRMPQVSGLEFFDVITERWPYSKVIFLTGYSEFDYVYKVNNRARYVLKADGDDKILQAVRETIAELESELYMDSVVQRSEEALRQKNAAEAQMLLQDIIHGHIPPGSLTPALAERLGIALDPGREIYYAVLCLQYGAEGSYESRLEQHGKLSEMVWKYLNHHFRGVLVMYTRNFGLLLLQPAACLGQEQAAAVLRGGAELFQKAYAKNFGGTASLCLSDHAMGLAHAVKRFHLLRSELLAQEGSVLLVDRQTEEAGEPAQGKDHSVLFSRAQMMDYYIENNDFDGMFAIIREAKEACGEVTSMHDLSIIAVYTAIASRLIAFTYQMGLSEEMSFRIGVANLYILSLHRSWREAFDYLLSVTGAIRDLRQRRTDLQSTDIVENVKDYILNNLGGDTSLNALADYAGFSPEHLLRLFKKREGTTILQHISDLKLSKAKHLLQDSRVSVREVASALGFGSTGYFGRFFRSRTGLSPQAWREKRGSERPLGSGDTKGVP